MNATNMAESIECPPQCQNQRILIVDDEPSVADVFRNYILSLGCFRADTAISIDEFRKLFTPDRYFLVILDLYLGKALSDGMDLAREIRQVDPDVFIVVVSGYEPPFDVRLLENINATLQKPIDYKRFQSNLFLWSIQYNRFKAVRHAHDETMTKRIAQLEYNCEQLQEISEQINELERMIITIDNERRPHG
jgi:DNA-binding NtrC family response regulator